MNDLKFNCTECGQHLTVDLSCAGMTVVCPKCGQVISVPQMARIVATAETPKPMKWAWIVASIGAIALLAAGVLIWRTHRRMVAATLPGRWASEEGGSDYGQFHVFSAFFEPGIGWTTFDVLNKFGSVPGNFIAFSLTDEDCPQQGIVRKLDQFQIWTYHGHSPFHPKYEDHWHVKIVSKK